MRKILNALSYLWSALVLVRENSVHKGRQGRKEADQLVATDSEYRKTIYR